MLIKNVKTEYCNDQYQDTEIFHVNLSDEICNEIIEGEKALYQLNLNFSGRESICGSNILSFAPFNCFCPVGMIICINIGNNCFMLEIEDEDSYIYETEWLPIEALTKERFLLQLGDDREVMEYNEEEGDDIDDFTPFYADSLEEASKMLLLQTADVREGFGDVEDAESLRRIANL